MFFWDPTMVLLIPAMILAFYAQWKVQSTYRKFSEIASASGRSGREIAQLILRQNGIHDVEVEEGHGFLSDHYDPLSKRVRLSPHNYAEPSISALAVSAHEVGHAIQHARAYAPLQFRTAIVPAVNIGSSLGIFVLIAGIFLQMTELAWIGVGLFALATIFALVTLPVEFDASRRAKAALTNLGFTDGGLQQGDETSGVSAVLNAAAWTYVAGFAASVLTLLYYVMLVSGMSRDE